MFDAHNHLDRCVEPQGELEAARVAGVRGQILAGVDPLGWQAQAELARPEPDLWVAFGVHPWTAIEAAAGDEALLLDQLDQALAGGLGIRPVALGELGLDQARGDRASRPRQERLFRAQLALARQRSLPVVLHIVRAHGRALELLRADGLPAAGGQVHSASTPAELVPAYLDLGLHLSFAGNITRHPKARAAAAAVPLDRCLVETDAPDQPPADRQGPNRPAWLGDMVAALADVHGCEPDTVAAATAANARRLFGLGDPGTTGG